MFTGVVLLDLYEVLLRMRTDLNDVLGSHVALNLLPRSTVLFQRLEEELVLFRGPDLSVLSDDVFLSWFLRGRSVCTGVLVLRISGRGGILLFASFRGCGLGGGWHGSGRGRGGVWW